jgi:Tfp pilus assembly protein PilO
MDKISINVSKKSFGYLAIYGAIIFIVLMGILFLYYKIVNQVKENDKLTHQIKEQTELKPVYAALNAMKNKDALALPHPEKVAISRSEAGKFQDEFRMIAKKSGLTLVSIIPDMNTSAGSSPSFLHNIVLKGEFADFRRMLIGLGSVPYLDKIDEVNIQQNTDSMEFKMKVWIAVK